MLRPQRGGGHPNLRICETKLTKKSKRRLSQDSKHDHLSKMPRPVSKAEQEKCMSKCDKKVEKYVKDMRQPRSSTPVEARDKSKSINDLDPKLKKSGAGKQKGLKDLGSKERVSQTVMNITEMKIQNKESKGDDSSTDTGSVHYPGDREFKRPDTYDVPSNTLDIMVSHVNSPTDFYIHPVSKVWGETLLHLNHGLKKQVEQLSGKKLKKISKTFTPEVGDLCCAQFSQDNQFYRALITYIELSTPTKKSNKDDASEPSKIHVLYIDFGDKDVLPRGKVYPLPVEYKDIPGLAIHCSLAYIQPAPPGEGKWTNQVVDKFSELVGLEKMLKMLIMLGDITYTVDK